MISNNLEHNLKKFYKELDEELYYFRLEKASLIESHEFIVYECVDGELAGIGGVFGNSEIFLVVKNHYQDKKIGQKILKKIIDKAKGKKYKILTLTVYTENNVAFNIYKKYGFIKLFTFPDNEMKSIFMFKPLKTRGYFYLISILFKLAFHYLILLKKRIFGKQLE